jgi:ligand-binding SRPBCC domain-containing protein
MQAEARSGRERSIEPEGSGYVLRQRQVLDAPIDELFAFFAEPANLEAITPDRLGFAIREAEKPIEAGTRLTYRLRLRGVPLRWVTRIAAWDPPRCFVDVQEKGPYRRWEHTHLLVDHGEVTVALDRVRYELPAGPLGWLAHEGFVEEDLHAIFAYRAERLAERFGEAPDPVEASQPQEP